MDVGMPIYRIGYAFTFAVYTGRNNDGSVETGLGHKVVMEMTEPMQGCYRQIYFDNFFNSPQLQLDLMKVKTYSCGTIRPNRKGFPDSLRKVKLKRGEANFAPCGDMVASTWQDKCTVNVLSTNSSPEMQQITRIGKGGKEESVMKPNAVISYNAFMGGVDLHDQNRSYYDLGRTSVKWRRYLFWWFWNSAIVNSYILYKLKRSSEQKPVMNHFQYRHLLAKQLCGGQQSVRRVAQKRKIERTLSVEGLLGHKLVKMPGRKRVCVLCSAEGRKTVKVGGVQTTFGCEQCAVNPCKSMCFAKYHNQSLLK
ncbi:hypothetical protein SNE40_015320 [Patella caerulea]|uniref:PiggyBac transposable element-derived protein domain-containing protein n=1 Tax=Patella caerulea TaxID=87958 RepID=A0AAN8PKM0_PATCE